jgi:hypothetical protein
LKPLDFLPLFWYVYKQIKKIILESRKVSVKLLSLL